MRGRTVGAALTVAALLLVGTPSAAATEGSVPAVVTAYIATDLVADLNDFYGEDASGAGIDFDESTTFSPADRIFAFVDEQRTDVELLNEWETRVSIAKKLVGLAIVTIDVATSEPQLARFERSNELAAALNELPAEGALVHDKSHDTWVLVAGDEVTTLYASTASKETVVADGFPTPLIGLGIALVIVVFLLWRRRWAPSADLAE